MTLFTGMTEKQLLVITAGMVAVCVAALGIGIGYGRLRHSRIVAETRETRRKLRELPRLRKEINRLIAQKEDMTALADEMSKVLPDEDDAGEHDLRAMLSIFSDDAGLDWIGFSRLGKSLSPAEKKRRMKDPYIKEEYVLDFIGGFHALATFINKLEEECSRLVWVDKITVEGAMGGLDPAMDDHEITIRLVAFKFKKPKGARAPK